MDYVKAIINDHDIYRISKTGYKFQYHERLDTLNFYYDLKKKNYIEHKNRLTGMNKLTFKSLQFPASTKKLVENFTRHLHRVVNVVRDPRDDSMRAREDIEAEVGIDYETFLDQVTKK